MTEAIEERTPGVRTVTDFESKLSGMFDTGVSAGRGLVFVQGIWRSGTSWVGQMLDSDASIYICPHELQSFMRMVQVTQFGEPLASNPFLHARHAAARKTAFLAMLLHLHRSEKPNARYIGERSPGADVWLLKENFPEAKFIVMLRDGRDICVSSAYLAAATGANHNLVDARSGQVALHHVIASALSYSAYVPDYFSLHAAHPQDVLLVHYEDMHRDTVAEMTRVFAFLGLERDPATIETICRDHTLSEKNSLTTNPDNPGFWVRKGAVGDWRKHLDEGSLHAFEEIAGPALQQAGYELAGAPVNKPFPSAPVEAMKPDAVALTGFESKLSGMFDSGVSAGRDFVFVQGIWRSGTSWVGQMIDSDPRIYICPHELQTFMRMLNVTQFGLPIASNPFLQARHAAARKSAFLAMLLHLRRSEKAHARRIGERSPGADVRLLKENFPEAKFVIMLRDGRDICVSSAFLAATSGADPDLVDARSGQVALHHAIASALTYATFVPDYFSLQAAHPQDVLLVHYEDMHRDSVAEMTRVFAFLNLPKDPATIEAICRDHALSHEDCGTTNPEHAGFWARTGAVGDWRTHMDEVSVHAFEAIAGPALRQAGYVPAGAPVNEPFPVRGLFAFGDVFQLLVELERELTGVAPGHDSSRVDSARRLLLEEANHIFGGRVDVVRLLKYATERAVDEPGS